MSAQEDQEIQAVSNWRREDGWGLGASLSCILRSPTRIKASNDPIFLTSQRRDGAAAPKLFRELFGTQAGADSLSAARACFGHEPVQSRRCFIELRGLVSECWGIEKVTMFASQDCCGNILAEARLSNMEVSFLISRRQHGVRPTAHALTVRVGTIDKIRRLGSKPLRTSTHVMAELTSFASQSSSKMFRRRPS